MHRTRWKHLWTTVIVASLAVIALSAGTIVWRIYEYVLSR
jgi:hypothetical protein